MYIKTFFDGAAVIISEEQDRTCSHPDGHELNPDRGGPPAGILAGGAAAFGVWLKIER